MSKQFLVQVHHPHNLIGDMNFGVLDAESTDDAREKIVGFLTENGMPTENIIRVDGQPGTIMLKGNMVIRFAPALPLEQWWQFVPLLVAE